MSRGLKVSVYLREHISRQYCKAKPKYPNKSRLFGYRFAIDTIFCLRYSEPDLLNDAIFGAIYYRLLLCSGPLTRRFGDELIEPAFAGTARETLGIDTR